MNVKTYFEGDERENRIFPTKQRGKSNNLTKVNTFIEIDLHEVVRSWTSG